MTPLPEARIEAATRRLYDLLPAHIRSVDADRGFALEAFVKVLAAGSAEIDEEIGRLYDSMFVETAPEGALGDLAALVASEPLRPLPAGSGHNARAFIANTVRYRRGKGVARVLEELAADVGGFGAVAVEYFMRLARTQNLIDVRAERPGTGFLVPPGTASRLASAFDVQPRLLDVRSIARARGRHHMAHVGVHLLRPLAPDFPAPARGPDGENVGPDQLDGTPVARPWPDGATEHAGYFQLSAQPGRPLRLFNPDRRLGSETPRAQETELRDRLRRLPLHLETEEKRQAKLEDRAEVLGPHPWFNKVGQPFCLFFRRTGLTTFERVPEAEIQICNLDAYPAVPGARPKALKPHRWWQGAEPAPLSRDGDHPIRCGFDPVTGRLIVAEPVAGTPDVEEVRVAYAGGIAWPIGAGPQDRNTAAVAFEIIDRAGVQNLVWQVDATQPAASLGAGVRRVQTLHEALDEWTAAGAGKRGFIVLARCDREFPAAGASNIQVEIPPKSELHIVSAEWRNKVVRPGVPDNPERRGYVVRRQRRSTIDAPLRVIASSPPPDRARAGVLVLDGLELAGGLTLMVRAVSRVLVRHCTVRAPGGAAVTTTAPLEGMEVAFDRSILGRIDLDFGPGPATGSLAITDSIVAPDGAAGFSISARMLDATLDRVTVFGTSRFKSLEATDVIFAGAAAVARRQAGCVRFSSIAPGSTMPRRFRCQPDLALAMAAERKGAALTAAEAQTVALGVTPLFLDTSLDEPTVAMLHPMTSDAIRLGGEGDAEMGVFSAAAHGLRMANVTSLFDDFIPFGLEAGLIDDTCSSAVATRRMRP